MKYQQMLFSRSEGVDYRWIIVPNFLTEEDCRFIEDTIWSDKIRNFFDGFAYPLPLLFYMHVPRGSVLLKFGRTQFRDNTSSKRPIDALQGVAVEREEGWYLRFAISHILTHHIDILDVWGSDSISFIDADRYTIRRTSKEFTFDFGNLNAVLPVIFPVGFSQSSTRRQVEFSEKGFKDLVALMSPHSTYNSLNLSQFAFGILAESAYKFKNFELVSQLDHSSNTNRRVQIAEKSSIREETEVTSTRHSSDDKINTPSQDFNAKVRALSQKPEKKRITSQNKQDEDNDPIGRIWRIINPFRK